jgi:putative colanic acid biosynthesis acetyltransferase WcaF
MKTTDLSTFDNSWYKPGGNKLKRALWYYMNFIFLMNPWCPFKSLKVFILRLFGARVGKGVVIKPRVNIKYPWRLEIDDHVWIGENVWIDNLADIRIGKHVTISQGAMLLCGNHDYKKTGFDLITEEIVLEEGVWIGAKSVVCPGVTCGSHAVLSVNSTAVKNLEAYTVYQGNPASEIRKRIIE